MLNFLTESGFWALVTPFLVGFVLECFLTWSEPVLNKHPKALFWNNLFILVLLGFLIFIFIKRGWVEGFSTVILTFIVYMIISNILLRIMENNLLKKLGNKNENTD